MNGRSWTVADRRALIAMARAGDHNSDIAAALNRTTTAVRVYACKNGIRIRHPRGYRPDARAALLNELARSPGATLKSIARVLRKSHPGVTQMARRLTREGLLCRVGTRGRNVRYYVTRKWVVNPSRITSRA